MSGEVCVAGMVGENNRRHRDDVQPGALQGKGCRGVADVAAGDVGLDRQDAGRVGGGGHRARVFSFTIVVVLVVVFRFADGLKSKGLLFKRSASWLVWCLSGLGFVFGNRWMLSCIKGAIRRKTMRMFQ